MSVSAPRNLTEVQLRALPARFNLSDGHARHRMRDSTMQRLRELFTDAISRERVNIPEIERRFLASLSVQTGQEYGAAAYTIYSASVAIEMIAKYLTSTGRRTGLVEPTFDNIPALLRRGRFPLVAVPQDRMMPSCDLDYLDSLGLGALFVVNPNNPTGVAWDTRELIRVIEWAARSDVVVILDLSFRMLDRRTCGDMIALAETAGARLITIDDTGKAISLLDTKASVLATTTGLAPEIRFLYSEVLLNVSSLDLVLLTAVMDTSPRPDLGEIAWSREVARTNRSYLRGVLADVGAVDTFLPGSDVDLDSSMGVEWIRVGERQAELLRACSDLGLEVLGGECFHWNADDRGNAGREWIRVALLRDPDHFREAADVLVKAISTI